MTSLLSRAKKVNGTRWIGARWKPQSVWTFLRRVKSVNSAGNRTPNTPDNSAATVTTVLTRPRIQTIWIFNRRFKIWRKTHDTSPSVTHATLKVGILRLSAANPTNTSNNNYNILINQEFISVRPESETEWPITKSAQLQKKCHKQTEERKEKFMCN